MLLLPCKIGLIWACYVSCALGASNRYDQNNFALLNEGLI